MGGGGGGQSQTTSGGIDHAFRPYLEEVLSDVTGQYRQRRTEGPEATVAGHVAEKQEALRAAQQYGRDLSGGISPEMIERDLRNLQGQQLAGGQGTLGSARADRARQSALADRSLQLQQASDQRRGQGLQALAGVAEEQQVQRQRVLDAPHTEAQRYFGYLGSAPQQQTTTQSGGK